MRRENNAVLFWPVLMLVAALDVATKAGAVRGLAPQRVPHEILGSLLRFTLVYNPGAAFGLNLGAQSRWIFTALTVVALLILGRLYRATAGGDVARVLALALVCAGALGNLFDRLRSDLGVVDFIDVGLGDVRWPTFNVADMAVSCGAVLLAFVLWREDRVAATSQSTGLAVEGGASLSSATAADAGDFV